jgi:tetratricopeptide (TPR) repeat protein
VLGRLAEVETDRGNPGAAEKLLRESIRLLKPTEDRGTLCESQRALADALRAQGKLDEAERLALEAIETVGPHDVSSQASTRLSLALIRAAQKRDAEAETLMREACEHLRGTGYASLEAWMVGKLDQFLRECDRPDPAVAERLLELAPVAALGSAFASSTSRIA